MILFLLNVLAWAPQHWVHHLGPMFVSAPAKKVVVDDHHDHHHHHADASESDDQKHEQQVEEICWVTNSLSQNELQLLSNLPIVIKAPAETHLLENKYQNALLDNRHLLGDSSPRAPPLV